MKLTEHFRGKVVRAVSRYGLVGGLVHIVTFPWRFLRRLTSVGRLDRTVIAKQAEQFDKEFGVETAGLLQLATLDISGENRVHGEFYLGSEPELVRKVLADLPITYQDFVFVDYGSGKGRVLLLASQFQFKYIVGVEFAAELHRICEVNVKACRNPQMICTDIRPIHCDATIFEPPPDPLVLYFYNPFDRVIFKTVLNRIRISLQNHPRPIWIVYINPKDRRTFHHMEFLEEVFSNPEYCLYKSRE